MALEDGRIFAAATSTAFQSAESSYQSGARLTTYPDPYGIATTVAHEPPESYITWASTGRVDVVKPTAALR